MSQQGKYGIWYVSPFLKKTALFSIVLGHAFFLHFHAFFYLYVYSYATFPNIRRILRETLFRQALPANTQFFQVFSFSYYDKELLLKIKVP